MTVALLILAGAAAIAPLGQSAKLPERGAGCNSAIHHAFADASPSAAAKDGEPLMLSAIHKTIDNCRVLVMAGNPQDIRPEPAPRHTGRLHPAQ